MSEEKQGGLSGYRGYEYQIVASIWITLCLMLEVRLVAKVTVEPESQEDLEVVLGGDGASPDQKSSTVIASDGGSVRCIYQMKTRSTRHWSVRALKDVIGEAAPAERRGGGHQRRARALEMLLNDSSLSYTLVTDARVDGELGALALATLPLARGEVELPELLVGDAHRDSRAMLRGRLHILDGLNTELLEHRIRALLTKNGRVPHSQEPACMADLKNEFRRCMLGDRDTCFTLDELLSMLVRHGAKSAVGPGRGYVQPSVASQAAATLRKHRCVLIVGPPDIGKASLADQLSICFALPELPCPVIPVHDLAGVPECMGDEGPALLVVKDAWSGIGATCSHASSDLPAMLTRAPGDKYVIATCDIDAYRRLPDHMRSRLQPHVVLLEAKHYDDEARWTIVLRQANLIGWQLQSLETVRESVVRDLAEPISLNLFGTFVREHANFLIPLTEAEESAFQLFPPTEIDSNSRLFEELVDRALRETIVDRGTRLVSLYHNAPLQHAALVLGVYAAFAKSGVLWLDDSLPVIESIAERIAYTTGTRLHFEAFIEYLVSTEFVQIVEGRVLCFERNAHDALCRLVQNAISEVHQVLVAVALDLAESMCPANFAEQLERIMTVVLNAYPVASPNERAWKEVALAIDAHLESALDIRDRSQFVRNMEVSMTWGWGRSALSRLLFALHPERIPLVEGDDFWPHSHEVWDAVERVLHRDTLCQFVRRFLVDFIPYTWIDYGGVPAHFVSFLRASGAALGDDARSALHDLEDFVSTDWGDERWSDTSGSYNKPALLALLAASSQFPFVSRLPPPMQPWDL